MRSLSLIALLLTVTLVAGCGSGNSREPVYQVEGQVLVNGKPPAGAQVTFHPVGKDSSDVCRPTGQVDANGRFQLTTFAAHDGAPPGDYAVTVEWWLSRNERPAANQLPSRYQRVRSSGLRATVAAADTNVIPTIKLSR